MRQCIKQLATQPLPRVILTHGTEAFWHEQILATLQERNSADPLADWNWSVFLGSQDFDPEALFSELAMVPWGEHPKIIILKGAQVIPAAVMDAIATWLEAHPNSNTIAIFVGKLDNRLKYLKTLRKFAFEINCEPLQGEALLRYVVDYTTEQGKDLDRTTALSFLDRVGSELLTIHQELAKLINYTEGKGEITEVDLDAVTTLSPDQVENHTIFRLTDFIVQKKRDQALAVLNLLLSAGEPPFRILPLIERELRLVLAAKTNTGSIDQAAKQMGETSSFPLKKVLPHAKNFSLEELFAGFEAVVQGDRKMKLGIPGEQVLTDLIIKLTA